MSGLDEPNIILATDCGSTTSKARLFMKIGSEYRFIASGEAPTTVEAPYEDVTLGVRNAVREIEELIGFKLLSPEGIIRHSNKENVGVDLYVTTSSAGGGLQMMVAGVVKAMTAESAERAALGAGAIVMETIATNDGRPTYEKIALIRKLRPDMVLVAGGTDGGTTRQVLENAEVILTAEPKARFGLRFKLPIIYAGNKDARGNIKKLLGEKFSLEIVDNLRPTLETETLHFAREAVHRLFMEHVMSHAPGYDKLMKWTPIPIMPTPLGEGVMMQVLAELRNMNVIGVGLGGATTNIYSIFEGRFVRTVSANLGMSYSICNVLKEAGLENITRWMPRSDHIDVRNKLGNKMIRPTTIPQTLEVLLLEHAIAREALRLGFEHHRSLARGLVGIHRDKGIRLADETAEVLTYIDLMKTSIICATGGLLSHAPRRAQAALVLIDGFQPEGVTKLATDSVFMMPHLGVLSTVHREAAFEIFDKDCLIRLGTVIAPKGQFMEGGEMTVEIHMPDGATITEKVPYGTIKVVPLGTGKTATVEITPPKKGDVGAGVDHKLESTIEGGEVGIIMDVRGRPISLPDNQDERKRKLMEWFIAMDAYPKEGLQSQVEG